MRGATTLLIRETGVVAGGLAQREETGVAPGGERDLAAAGHLPGRLHRVLSVPKMRFSAHDVALREYTIRAPGGLHVLEPEESEEG